MEAKPALRRLARRGGIKRVNIGVYPEMQRAAREFLEQVVRRAVILVEHSKRKTVTNLDVVYALRTIGTPLYGFGDISVFDNRARLNAAKQKKMRMAAHKDEVDRTRRIEAGLRRMYTGT